MWQAWKGQLVDRVKLLMQQPWFWKLGPVRFHPCFITCVRAYIVLDVQELEHRGGHKHDLVLFVGHLHVAGLCVFNQQVFRRLQSFDSVQQRLEIVHYGVLKYFNDKIPSSSTFQQSPAGNGFWSKKNDLCGSEPLEFDDCWKSLQRAHEFALCWIDYALLDKQQRI